MSCIKNFFTGQVEFRVQSLPLSCLNKLRIFHLKQISIKDETTIFHAQLSHAALIKKLIHNFEYQVIENYNFFRGVNFLLNHFVLVVTILLAATVFLIADMGIYKIRVQCDNPDVISAVYEHLNQAGVKKFMWKSQLRDFDLAADLVDSFDNIAHAHVRVAGNTLVINLIAATNKTHKVKTNFYAQYDAVIKEVTAYSGTALVSTGDVVKKGDLLVSDAYPDSVVVTGEVAFINDEQISRLVIWLI